MIINAHHDPRIDLLRNLDLFRNCDRKELATLAQHSDDCDVAAGTIVCHQGEPGHQFLIIIEGDATVTIDGLIITTLTEGDFFGEMALLDGGPCAATVTATTPVRLLVLTTQQFHSFLATTPTVTRKMLAALAGRLRNTDRALTAPGAQQNSSQLTPGRT